MKRKLVAALLLGGAMCLPASWAVADDGAPVTQLDAVVVTADRSASTKKEVTANVTVIDNQTIESSSARDLGELLSQQGFQVRQYPGTLNSVGIRGYRSDTHGNDLAGRVLVLLNGRRMATGNVALFSLVNVDRIEIIHGPASVQYGAAAMGGVINVITKKGTGRDEDSFDATVEGGMGSYNAYKAAVNLAANVENFDAAFGYRYYESDDYSRGNGDKYRYTRYDGTNSFNLDAGYTFLDLHRVGINVNYFDADDAYSPGAFRTSYTSTTTYGVMQKRNVNGDFNYTGATPGQMFSWLLRYSVGEDLRKTQNYRVLSGAKGSSSKYTVDSQSGQSQLTFNSDYITLTGGFDYLNYDLDDNGSKAEYRNYAGFMLGKLRLFDERLIISAGLRYDDFRVKGKSQNLTKNEDEWTPSIGVAYNVFDWLKLRAHYAQGFIMPTPSNMFGDGGTYYIPNLNLGPEKNQTYEAGFDIGWNYLDFSFTYFYSIGKDAIVTQQQPNYMYLSTNWDKAIRSGIEIEFSGDVAKALGYHAVEVRPYINFNYMDTYKGRQNNGDSYQKLTYVPEYTIGYGVRFAYPEYNFTTTLNFSYFGEENIDTWIGMTQGPPAKHGKFTVVDWTARKQLFELGDYGKMDIKVEVNNIFDKDYAYVDTYPMPGRNFYVGLVYSY